MKLSEAFEGEGSSLRKTFDEVTRKPVVAEEKCEKCPRNKILDLHGTDWHICKPEDTPTAPLRKDFVEGKWEEESDWKELHEAIENIEWDSEDHYDGALFVVDTLKDFIRTQIAQAYAQGAQDMLSRAKEAVKGVCPDMPDETREIVDDWDDYTTGVSHAKSKALSALEALTPTP